MLDLFSGILFSKNNVFVLFELQSRYHFIISRLKFIVLHYLRLQGKKLDVPYRYRALPAVTNVSSLQRSIRLIPLLYHCIIVASSHHYLTITSPLPHHYLTITLPLYYRYLTVTKINLRLKIHNF